MEAIHRGGDVGGDDRNNTNLQDLDELNVAQCVHILLLADMTASALHFSYNTTTK